MKKKLFFVCIICLMMMQLVGCSDAIPDLSDEDMSMVTNYAAELLLKYNPQYKSKYLEADDLAEEEELQRQIEEEAARLAQEKAEKEAKAAEKAAQEEAAAGESATADTITNTDPCAFLGFDQFSVSCNGISYVDTYPESGDDMFFAMNASTSCKLAVVSLYVTNNSSETANLDIFDKQVNFKISINGGEYHSIASSYLEDDFSMYIGDFDPGQTKELVILIDLPEDECTDVSSIDMYMKCDGNTIKTNIY